MLRRLQQPGRVGGQRDVPWGQHPPWVGVPEGGCPLHPSQRAQCRCACAGGSCGFPLAAPAALMQSIEAQAASMAKRACRSALSALLPLPITADVATRRHSSLGAGPGSDKLVLVRGCWQLCWQVQADRGRCPHCGAVGDLHRADGHWLGPSLRLQRLCCRSARGFSFCPDATGWEESPCKW